MKIIVLVKQVPDTWGERSLDSATGALDRSAPDNIIDEISDRSLEVALRHKDETGAEVIVLTMGPASAAVALRHCLAMGADSAVHVLDDALAGADVTWTSSVLAAAITHEGFDMVIAGNESTDGRGGVIPAMVAEHLSVPHLTSLSEVHIAVDVVNGSRETDYGTLTVTARLPAIVSVTEQSPDARFPSFKGLLKAKKKPLATLSLSDLSINPETSFGSTGRSTITTVTRRPARTAGIKIVDSGNAGVELAEFLAAGRFV
ncbi:electron transfer flavoprotein subunit beta/FixA family protein [Cryobacterium gelidum]|uniref:Electron transfer flavoprotein subunit beta n=1 Tax=Cryobacterium gelidum TaxID=1259164 RepID=A0A4R9AT95_9MICO|nr:electron transfer flavoprotein subunit beta/FixA family protein [Cryobacterium gelidum]TFD68436.1 electron transfer flavoprotein subunit beta/FixA family protein [Cryobacterium gelidum]